MKKLRRQKSVLGKVGPGKNKQEFRGSKGSSKKHLQKRQVENRQRGEHKENRQVGQALARKEGNTRAKERSKSLLYDKIIVEPMLTYRQAFMDLQRKADKIETDISANANSIRHDRIFDFDKLCSSVSPRRPHIGPYLGLVDTHHITPKLAHLQEQNETLRADLSAVQEQLNHCIHENNLAKQENAGLRHRITEFEIAAKEEIAQLKGRDADLRAGHTREKESLEQRVRRLESEQGLLQQEKVALEELVKNQQRSIAFLESQKEQLEMQFEFGRRETEGLRRDKEEASVRIRSLEQQLELFEGNLREFEAMKKSYEVRLGEVQREKQKIKRNAFELLQMVQSYREW